jgi:hypothetical protein
VRDVRHTWQENLCSSVGKNSRHFFGNFAVNVVLNRETTGGTHFNYGKKMFRNGIGGVGICLWNGSTLKRRHRYD